MNIRSSTTLLTCAIALFAGVSNPVRAAYDEKAYSPMGCRPLTATDASGLAFDTRGIINTSTSNRRVICTIERDASQAYNPVGYASVGAWFKTGAIGGSLACTFYRGSAVSSSMAATTFASGPIAANSAGQVIWMDATSDAGDYRIIGQNVVCTLSSKVILAHFYLYENQVTDAP